MPTLCNALRTPKFKGLVVILMHRWCLFVPTQTQMLLEDLLSSRRTMCVIFPKQKRSIVTTWMKYITTSRKRLLVILIFGTYYLSLYATREISSSSLRKSTSLYMPSQTVWYAKRTDATILHWEPEATSCLRCRTVQKSTKTNTMQMPMMLCYLTSANTNTMQSQVIAS